MKWRSIAKTWEVRKKMQHAGATVGQVSSHHPLRRFGRLLSSDLESVLAKTGI